MVIATPGKENGEFHYFHITAGPVARTVGILAALIKGADY